MYQPAAALDWIPGACATPKKEKKNKLKKVYLKKKAILAIEGIFWKCFDLFVSP